MILDNHALFSDAQAITLAAIAPSTNVLDLGAMGITAYNPAQLRRRIAKANVPLLVQVVEDFAGAATNVNFKIQSCALEDFSAGVQDAVSMDVAVADLVVGYIFPMDKLPRNIENRYIRLAYTPNGIETAGQITAGIVAAVDGKYSGNK